MAKETEYSKKLKDPRWQKKRLEIFERDNWECQCCSDKEHPLHVHHRRYLPKRDPWDYPDKLLVTLCEDCHEMEGGIKRQYEDMLVSSISEKFYCNDINALAEGFQSFYVSCYDSHFVSSALNWLLTEPDLIKDLTEKYIVHMRDELEVGSNAKQNY
jgi:hypothetical protein